MATKREKDTEYQIGDYHVYEVLWTDWNPGMSKLIWSLDKVMTEDDVTTHPMIHEDFRGGDERVLKTARASVEKQFREYYKIPADVERVEL